MQKFDVHTGLTSEALDAAVTALRAGELVIYPTETSYGIAADATNPQAIDRLRAYKGNRQNKPFSLVVSDLDMAADFIALTPQGRELADRHLPGPLTLVATGISESLAPGVMGENGSLGIRIPDNESILEVVSTFGRPVTATSANPSDEKPPYSIPELLKSLTAEQAALIDVVLDAGTLPERLPTTIVDIRGQQPKVLRQGALLFEDKETIHSDSPEETLQIGQTLAKKYKSFWGMTPIIFALEGEMGAGKTHLIKGIAAGLGITGLIKSPSYALVHEHTFWANGAEQRFLHVDAWRLETPDEISTLGISEALQKQAIVALEWATQGQTLVEQWRSEAVIITIAFQPPSADDEFERTSTVSVTLPENLQ